MRTAGEERRAPAWQRQTAAPLQAKAGQVWVHEGVSQSPFQSGALRALYGVKATAEETDTTLGKDPSARPRGGTTEQEAALPQELGRPAHTPCLSPAQLRQETGRGWAGG